MEPAARRVEISAPALAAIIVAGNRGLPAFARWPLESGWEAHDKSEISGSTFLGVAASEEQARSLLRASGSGADGRFGRVKARFAAPALAGHIPDEIEVWAWVPIDAAIRHVQELVRMYVPEDVSLSEELMAERRAQAD